MLRGQGPGSSVGLPSVGGRSQKQAKTKRLAWMTSRPSKST